MKKCTKCGIEKPLSEFYKNKATKDGKRSRCKNCFALYRLENKDKITEYNARYYQENKEKICKKQTLYQQENKDKIAEYNARYRLENKGKITKQRARYRLGNKDKIAEYKALYYQENKEKIAKQRALYRLENKGKIAKQRARCYQERSDKQTACVYKITNKQNGKIYVGETLRGELRWGDHLRDLRGGYHRNCLLQEDFDKFGEEAFEWEILKEFPKDKETLLLEEARTINKFLKEDKELYNLTLTIEQLKLLQENGE